MSTPIQTGTRGVFLNLPMWARRERDEKTIHYMWVVVLGAFLVVFAGISQAGGWMHRSSGDKGPVSEAWETGATPDMASGGGTAYELRGTEHPFPVGFVAAGPIETGTLSASFHEEAWMKEYGND